MTPSRDDTGSPMYVIIWEYEVEPGREDDFARAYGPRGDWANLFAKAEGYLGTELLRDPTVSRRYVTIDRWTSAASYEAFRAEHGDAYDDLDRRFERLTKREAKMGTFTELPPA